MNAFLELKLNTHTPGHYNEHHTGTYTLEHAEHDPHASTPPAHVLAHSGRVHPAHARARCTSSPLQNGLVTRSSSP